MAATNRSQSALALADQQHQTGAGFALIDRHVLTENEILPSWDSPNKATWTTRFSRGFRTSLVYRFRVLCAANHYGDDCSTFCRPRNDQFGHFQCTQNGQKVCLDGWLGSDCAQAKCRTGCNMQHGFCDRPDTCQCRPGWTGARCDECLTYPGCQNGFCLAPWQCVCQLNWAGFLCDQDLNYCATHSPCENNATCQNVAPGRYKCHCPAGFTGLNCQLKLATLVDLSAGVALATRLHTMSGCNQNPCLNGGACLRLSPEPALPANSSERLQSNEGEEEQQQSAGRSYRCHCPAGFTGDYCQWAELPTGTPGGPLDSQPTDPRTRIETKTGPHQQVASSTPGGQLELETILPSFELPPDPSTQTELLVRQSSRPSAVEMRHLISGVVVASAIGVFGAALLLAWCCLIAIERGKFQLVQMNFVRGHRIEQNEIQGASFAASLRRVHAKIRDSFRRSTRASSIKPATKLSLENVLNPARLAPPSYEESNQLSGQPVAEHEVPAKPGRQHNDRVIEPMAAAFSEHLVKRGALEREMALKQKLAKPCANKQPTEPANCPRHGHLYKDLQPYPDTSTTIEIEYKPPDS